MEQNNSTHYDAMSKNSLSTLPKDFPLDNSKIDINSNLLIPLLQLTDSAFPTGGFSHSLGLEAFIQFIGLGKALKDHKPLYRAFVSILENSGSFILPFVRAAHMSVVRNLRGLAVNGWDNSPASDGHSLLELDKLCEACTTNHVARRASTRQGKSLMEVACFTYEHLAKVLPQDAADLPHCHFPVVYGAVLAALGLDEVTALASFMYSVVRSAIATAVRLDVIGALEGQKVQHNLQLMIPDIIDKNRHRSVDEACMKFPVIDVLHNIQDNLFCKLFYS